MDWAGVRPMRPDQRVEVLPPGSPIRVAQEAFNTGYGALLVQLELALNGRPEGLDAAVGAMYRLKTQAEALMRMPIGDGPETAGPTFEWVPRHRRA